MKNPFCPKALLCILILLLSQSCSIQKRRYTGGFHIEWHNEKNIHDVAEDKAIQPSNDPIHEPRSSSDNLKVVSEHNHDSLSQTAPVLCARSQEKVQNKKHQKWPLKIDKTRATPSLLSESTINQESIQIPKEHEGARSSLRMMLLSYLLGIITIALFIYIALFFYVHIGGYIALILGFLAFVFSFILAMIASVKAMYSVWDIGRSPEFYTNKWQAILAIILGVFYLSFLYLIPLFIFMIKVNVTKSKEKSAGNPPQSKFDSHD